MLSSRTISPDAQLCLENLTRLVSKSLSGNLHVDIAPWLIGAPVEALRKMSGGVRSITIGEVLRRLVSRVRCSAIKSRLPDVLLPYGQVGVGVKGGLEAAVHSIRSYIEEYGHIKEL